MNFKNYMNSLLTYTPKKEYEFDILENPPVIEKKSSDKQEKIYTSISENLKYIKTTYNTLINSDIIIREFNINVKGKHYNAFLLYIDGMIDSNIMNDFILKPLMLRNQNNILSETTKNNITIRRVKKMDLSQYLLNCLIPQNSIKKEETFEKIISGVNSGNCALFVDTLNSAFDIEVKGFKQRSIDAPNNEVVVKGSQEAFVENIRTNTSILRRIINNENLIIENVNVGNISRTKCGICYMQNITNSDLVAETKYRINNLAIDSLLSSRRIRAINF